YLLRQAALPLAAWAFLAALPLIKTRRRDPKGLAQLLDAMALPLLMDECVLHPRSLAKYAAAFFRISTSSWSSATSLRRRAFSSACSLRALAERLPWPGNAPASPCASTSSSHLYSWLRLM